jgi:ABC-type nitrate/sulfonate/bicarbonate transport system ATPase subunit
MTPMIECRGLARSFGSRAVLHPLDLQVARGETLGIMGASGAGKTTLLRCIAGLDRSYQGSITFDGQPAAAYLAAKRAAMVFQHYTNFHWMTVRENLAEAQRVAASGASNQTTDLDEMLAAVGLTGSGDQYIATLSGGMQQRVALARVLLQESDVILLDEPFGALDIVTRSNLQDFTKKQFHYRDKTVLFVTHDPSEALYLSDRILVLYSQGRYDIVDSPSRETLEQKAKLSSEFIECQSKIIRGMTEDREGADV